jgi:Na+/H+ antiporter NhaA/protein-disulfide isomerase
MREASDDLVTRVLRYCAAKLRGLPENIAAAAAASGEPSLIVELEAASDQDTVPAAGPAERWTHHTDWRHGIAAPFQAFASAETGGASLLLLAIAVALLWTNLPWHSTYETFWSNTVSVNIAGHVVATDFRGVINDGLMTLFFLVVGLEGKRELDLGELRDRSRLTVPVIAGFAGIAASVLVYLAFTSGSSKGGAGGWGVAVSTDTALALGALSLVTSGRGARLRVFLLTMLVIDDLVSLVVITIVYPTKIHLAALITAAVVFAILMGLREYGRRHRDDEGSGAALFALSVLMGFGLWLALFQAGVDPVITGLVIGLLTSAYAPRRTDLERGTELTRSFRLDPNPQSAHAASVSLSTTISPNERLQYRLEPLTSRIIVPLFALANAGLHINGTVISSAVSSPITWGILAAFAVGKPAGILAAAWVTAKGAPRRGKLPVAWRELFGTASVAGVGFTVSLLIASRAFTGSQLADAKLGVLGTAVLAPLLASLAFRTGKQKPQDEPIPAKPAFADLATDIDTEQDHILGAPDAPVTVTMYGSFGCVYSAAGARAAREVLERLPGKVRYVYRHLPLDDLLPGAELAAEASEAAAAQARFWPMYGLLAEEAGSVSLQSIYRAARDTGLDLEQFFADLGTHAYVARVERDIASADESGVTGTPAFFVNGERYEGAFDADSLAARVERTLMADHDADEVGPRSDLTG